MTPRTPRRRILQGLAGLIGAPLLPARANAATTTVRWLHIEQNPEVAGFYADVARRFEAATPGVKVELQYLENESFKRKLTTLLQSPDKPHIVYSWAGGVLREQVKAGVIQDIGAAVDAGGWRTRFGASGLQAYTVGGKLYGLPMLSSQVGFFYSKPLFAKAGVDAAAIKTWDEFLAAVKKLQAAGITPLVVGGADKWPLHFYWSHLALRGGGRAAFESALTGAAPGFQAPAFVKAGELFAQLAALQPFQRGWQSATYPQSCGQFGDGKGAMMLMLDALRNAMRANAADRVGVPDEQLGWFPFPTVPGGQGAADETMGGMNGWLVTQGAPRQAVDFLGFLLEPKNQRIAAERGYYIPAVAGAREFVKQPILRQLGENVAQSPYHQLFYDQMLGPSAGAVVNDASFDLATGRIKPADAAARVQQAWLRSR